MRRINGRPVVSGYTSSGAIVYVPLLPTSTMSAAGTHPICALCGAFVCRQTLVLIPMKSESSQYSPPPDQAPQGHVPSTLPSALVSNEAWYMPRLWPSSWT